MVLSRQRERQLYSKHEVYTCTNNYSKGRCLFLGNFLLLCQDSWLRFLGSRFLGCNSNLLGLSLLIATASLLHLLGGGLGSVANASLLLCRHLEAARPLPSWLSTRHKHPVVAHLLQGPVQKASLLGYINLILAAQELLDGVERRPRPLLLLSDGLYHHVLVAGVARRAFLLS